MRPWRAFNNLAVAAQTAAPVAAPEAPVEADIEEDDLQDIFLEEAREVVQTGLAAIQALTGNPGDVAELTTLRRAFHTLKGSSRMVGLTEFGDAAWSMEQVLNTLLADQKPASEDMRSLAADAVKGFGRWVEDIARGEDADWKAAMFRGPADALRTEQRLVALALPKPSMPIEEATGTAAEWTSAMKAAAAFDRTIGFEVQVPDDAPLPHLGRSGWDDGRGSDGRFLSDGSHRPDPGGSRRRWPSFPD